MQHDSIYRLGLSTAGLTATLPKPTPSKRKKKEKNDAKQSQYQ